MKRIAYLTTLIIIISVLFVGCGNKASSNAQKVYGHGEEVFMTDKDGKQMYSIKINSVKAANDFEYKGDFSSSIKEIVEVNYTYKNIAKADENKLMIMSGDFIVSDITGAVGTSSDMYPNGIPQSIPVGTNCTVGGYYGLLNKSDTVKISFSSTSYNKTLTFEIPVTK